MPTPSTAKAFPQATDPGDELEFYSVFKQGDAGDDPTPVLLTGEGIMSFSIAASLEATAAGLTVENITGRTPTLGVITNGAFVAQIPGNVIRYWPKIADNMVGSSIFNGGGVAVSLKFTVVTTASPSRTKNLSVVHQIANQ